MIREVNSNDILDFALKYFPNFKISDNPFEKIYAFFEEEEIIGFIASSIIYDRCEIEYFVVKEEYRGCGIAQKLLDYLISSIKGDNISLEVKCNNERAINFYLKNGFEKVSTRKNYYNGVDGYLMVKQMR